MLPFCSIKAYDNVLPSSVYGVLQKKARVVAIDGYENVPQNNEESLKKALAHQPVSVAIEAGGRAFQLYQSVMRGFFSMNTCS